MTRWKRTIDKVEESLVRMPRNRAVAAEREVGHMMVFGRAVDHYHRLNGQIDDGLRFRPHIGRVNAIGKILDRLRLGDARIVLQQLDCLENVGVR